MIPSCRAASQMLCSARPFSHVRAVAAYVSRACGRPLSPIRSRGQHARRASSARHRVAFRLTMPDTIVPYLRLSGRWLEEHVFVIGKTVQVRVERGRVTLIARRLRKVERPLFVAAPFRPNPCSPRASSIRDRCAASRFPLAAAAAQAARHSTSHATSVLDACLPGTR